MADEIVTCPACGALPCDQVETPKVRANWDVPLNEAGDTLRSLLEEFERFPAHDVAGMDVVRMSISKSNRDAFAAAIRELLSEHLF